MLWWINQTLSQNIMIMCEGQCGELQCWTLINVPGRHGADFVQGQVGLTELWWSASYPGEGGSKTANYFMLQSLIPPIHWNGTTKESPAKGYKRVEQADWFLTVVPFHKTGLLPSVNAALWTVRPSCPCRQGEHLRPVRRVGVGLQNLLNELRAHQSEPVNALETSPWVRRVLLCTRASSLVHVQQSWKKRHCS